MTQFPQCQIGKSCEPDGDEVRATQARFRIALLVADPGFSDAALRLIDRIVADQRFEMAGFLIADRDLLPWPDDALRRSKSCASVLLRLVRAIEQRLSGKRDTTVPLETPAHLRHVRTQRFAPSFVRAGDRVVKDISEHVEPLHLDVILCLERLPEEFNVGHARFGLWSLTYSDNRDIRGQPPGFWEVYLGHGVTGVTLEARTPERNVTGRIANALFPTKMTYSRNLTLIRDNAVELVWRELRKLQYRGNLDLRQSTSREFSDTPLPNTVQVLGYISMTTRRIVGKFAQALARKAGIETDRWSLFVGKGSYDCSSWSEAVESLPPKGENWADPFLFRRANDVDPCVFFEAFGTGNRRGRISVGRIRGQRVERLGDAIITPYHMSYPHVFSYEGGIWMVPETAEMRRIELWRCVDYPLRWQLEKTVLEGHNFVDPSICEYQGHWWLFLNASSHNSVDHNSELHIFRLGSPMLNDIVPHRLNPVVIDATRARNGGRIHQRNGALMRSGQDNSFRYGYGLGVYAIKKLTLDDYEEELVFRVQPNFRPGLVACHHLDMNEGIFVFDGQRSWPRIHSSRYAKQ